MTAVVGLDLSLTSTGICDSEGNPSTVAGPASDGDARLVAIASAVSSTLFLTDLVVIEDLPRGAMGGSSTGMVQGVVRYLLRSANIPYALVSPASLKMYATGKGSADKVAMALAAYKVAGVEFPNSDECDAWWLRAMGLDAVGQAQYVLPATHRRALAKVDWPVTR